MHRLSTEPCDKCLKATTQCEYRQVDQKRRPASHDHVTLLQNRISWLENFIIKLQGIGHDERDTLLRAISLAPSKSPNVSQVESTGLTHIEKHENAVLHLGPKGELSYHGPTSIYRVHAGDKNSENNDISRNEPSSNVGTVLDHFGIDINATVVTESLMLFFKWQYPQLMFVYRDAFLRDHFGNRHGSKYWSTALLLSICALGSLLLEDSYSTSTSEQFFGAAESIALVTGLTQPSIITVQVFLCLAFYEIGRGNASKGWAYSG
ncbi:hypothetical protein N7456_010375 [Penicillium angulare]|uniref:Xylanolytic transcriptional activator regulatory domain-containing protein n=1 Tax=Penicillium angulare TaxID=116970 RepID=A0A9W9K651_9EURO|nr:hypothetical protein N7456_010375 [Penicillium angulare]